MAQQSRVTKPFTSWHLIEFSPLSTERLLATKQNFTDKIESENATLSSSFSTSPKYRLNTEKKEKKKKKNITVLKTQSLCSDNEESNQLVLQKAEGHLSFSGTFQTIYSAIWCSKTCICWITNNYWSSDRKRAFQMIWFNNKLESVNSRVGTLLMRKSSSKTKEFKFSFKLLNTSWGNWHGFVT